VSAPVRRISLALQGGGAHGAFTWGALDRLLEEDDLEIAAISGTSAGALNGAALKAGLVAGGPKAAKAALRRLWDQIAEASEPQLGPWLGAMLPWLKAASGLVPVSGAGIAAQLVSPYAFPGWTNPLEPVVRAFDFSQVCDGRGPELHISATSVHTGRIRVFSGTAVTPEALMASACLPTLFQAVEIEGEPYWDGGFSGNPALFPLYQPNLPDDIVIVQINPLERRGLPTTPLEIQDRMNEISFNAALLGELRAIAFVRRLIAEGRMEAGRMKNVHTHLIADDKVMNALSADSKMMPDAALIDKLFKAGRRAAAGFLRAHGDKIGREASLDIGALLH